jgi:predicted aconitase
MSLQLSTQDQAKLNGDQGPAVQMAMSILVQMAEVYGASELLDITGAHIDSTIYIGEAGLEFAERLASLGAHVAVPSTLNVSGLDEHHWQEWRLPIHGSRSHMDLRSIPERYAPQVRAANRMGGVKRNRLRQLGHRGSY